LWCARLCWAILPVTAGAAIADVLDEWSRAPAVVAAILLWMSWLAGIVALLAPRPWGLTVLRVVAPAAVVVAVTAAFSTNALAAFLAVASCLVAALLALSAPVVQETGNALAYGDEVRFPLRIPLPLLLAPVPLAVALVVAGVAAGPLLLAAGNVVAGVAAIVVGVPVALFLARSLHSLSRRWLVLVPAGVALVDPLILIDPVLMVRDVVAGIVATEADSGRDLDRALDLRLGSTARSTTLVLREPVTFGRRAGRTAGTLVDTDIALVAPSRRAQLLELARRRHLTAS
jgi:hypothetical protein